MRSVEETSSSTIQSIVMIGCRLVNASMLVRSDMRADICPATSSSSSQPPTDANDSDGDEGTSGRSSSASPPSLSFSSSQLGQVSRAAPMSRCSRVSSWILSRSCALRASRIRRWVSCDAAIASIWLLVDSPLASRRLFSSSKTWQK